MLLKFPCIMGILNVTPDSFYSGSRVSSVSQAVEIGLKMVEEGAAILDIGGESTRPGSAGVDEEEEISRVLPVIDAIRKKSDIPISLDTTKSRVAREGLRAGATIINDVSGLRHDPALAGVVADAKAVLILMHSRGTPATMQNLAQYDDVVEEVKKELMTSVNLALKDGVQREKIWIDPGFGFAKLPAHNIEMLGRLEEFRTLEFPLVIGLSRKKFIGVMTGCENPEDRLAGSLAGALVSLQKGADCLRVHDVRASAQVLQVWQALKL